METHRDKGCLCGLTLVNIWFQAHVLELQIAHGPQTSSSVTRHLEICSKRKNPWVPSTLDASDTVEMGPGVCVSTRLPGVCDVLKSEDPHSLHP